MYFREYLPIEYTVSSWPHALCHISALLRIVHLDMSFPNHQEITAILILMYALVLAFFHLPIGVACPFLTFHRSYGTKEKSRKGRHEQTYVHTFHSCAHVHLFLYRHFVQHAIYVSE